MDINFLRGLVTLLLVILFVGMFVYVYHPKRAARFKNNSKLPFIGEEGYIDE